MRRTDPQSAPAWGFDAPFLLRALEDGLLAASPRHAIVADPFLCGPLEEEPPTLFLCSHIPDIHVGDPTPILLKSSRIHQGVKC